MFMDAYFAGMWCKEFAELRDNILYYRTGYIIIFCGYPVAWCSKLQTEITLLTMEKEYSSQYGQKRAAAFTWIQPTTSLFIFPVLLPKTWFKH
jgi:hypothetical protein